MDNIKIFEKIKQKFGEQKISQIEETLFVILKGESLKNIFTLEYYNKLLTQNSIDFFNQILGGHAEDSKKIQGLNEYINLYNQQQKDKKDRIPKLKVLYKQILSDKQSISFLPETFKNSQEILKAIQEYYNANLINRQDKGKTENTLEKIQELLSYVSEFDTTKIYIRNDSVTNISQALFGDWAIISAVMREFYTAQCTNASKQKDKPLTKTQQETIKKALKQDYFSVAEIENMLKKYRNQNEKVDELLKTNPNPVANYFKTHFKAKKKEESDKEFTFVANIQAKYKCIEGLLNTDYPQDKSLHTDKDNLRNIKHFLDAIMELLHFVKVLVLTKDTTLEKDEEFYSALESYYEELKLLIPLYNKVRNYATQKPYSTKKIKLNFENSTLLNGWDKNKEADNTCVLFRKNDDFYLGIIDKKHNKIFKNIPKPSSNSTSLKMEYKFLPGANKMLPKVFFAKSKKYCNLDADILRIRNHSTHTKNGTPQKNFQKLPFNLEDCHKMIDFFKQSIQKHSDWKNFDFQFSETHTYQSIDEFYREVETQGYHISFTEIDETYIHNLVNEGKLYLFQIYNKDFSRNKKPNRKPNLHTLYWKALFDPENIKNVVYKLNGEAEIFYRKKSISAENIIKHPANQLIPNKNPNNPKKYSTFEYDLIKDKHYTEDKFLFHVPITINFKVKDKNNINKAVQEHIKNNTENINVIGIDRGERHLLYLTVIDPNGKILHQESLNIIKNDMYPIEVDYHNLLHEREKQRDKERKEWGIVQNIKELKEGYISQVVHKITKLMTQYNAIVVMEDLNAGFKRSRIKVEKQVYQKFEKMLIDKLNCLVFKDKNPHEPGGLFKPLQLTNKFESFEKIGKQNGFLFYIPAWNTSKIDPTTGFVNLFGGIKYENVQKAQAFFNKFNFIRYNAQKDYFEFDFDYNELNKKAENTKSKWTVCTYGERIETFRNPQKNNQWDNRTVNLTQELKTLLNENNIAYSDEKDIKNTILKQSNKNFFEKLLCLFKLTMQMRNSITGTDTDYLISPVINAKGEFFDSRKADNTLPKNADANGAYHIAKKGLLLAQHIKNHVGDHKKIDLSISNKEWLQFVQNNL